jgi:hypothetical protein
MLGVGIGKNDLTWLAVPETVQQSIGYSEVSVICCNVQARVLSWTDKLGASNLLS